MSVTAVSGEMAAAFDALSLSDFTAINKGKLLSADEATGAVSWVDAAEKTASNTPAGPHTIKILPRAKR